MYDHHQRTIERLADKFRDDPRYPALIVGGSVAKGRAQPGSDVDIILVCTEEEWARRRAANDLWYSENEGVFVDGKAYGLEFLEAVADRGSEPARSAFTCAFPAYSRIPGLDALLSRILTYPESERDGKIRSFYSQVSLLSRFFVGEAEKRCDPYLMCHAVSELVLFGSRLILAHNRILYPYHKWLMWELERAPEKPDGFLERTRDVLAAPTSAKAIAYCECLEAFHDWGVSAEAVVNQFIVDSEWNWLDGRPPLQDW